MKEASKEESLRDLKNIRYQFINEAFEELKVGCDDSLLPKNIEYFKKMLTKQDKSSSFGSYEIRCKNLNIFFPMVIFTISYVLWNLRPILVPKIYLSKLVELLKEKMQIKILKPFFALYFSFWFVVLKKNRSLHFIQDIQLMNVVTIKNAGIGPLVDEFAEALANSRILL